MRLCEVARRVVTARPTREIVARAVAVGGVLVALGTFAVVGPDPVAVLAFTAGCVAVLTARAIAGRRN